MQNKIKRIKLRKITGRGLGREGEEEGERERMRYKNDNNKNKCVLEGIKIISGFFYLFFLFV